MKMYRFIVTASIILLVINLVICNSFAGTKILYSVIPGSDQVYVFSKFDDYKCYKYARYYVAAKEYKSDGNILVKYLQENEGYYDCQRIIEEYDFEIDNLSAEYFIGIYDNLLFIDEGTSPGYRGLTIYDLSKKEKVYETSYRNIIDISKQGILSFWTFSSYASKENHPDYERLIEEDFEPVIERKVYLDLKNFEIEKSKETRPSSIM